jgi:hypothetical protein
MSSRRFRQSELVIFEYEAYSKNIIFWISAIWVTLAFISLISILIGLPIIEKVGYLQHGCYLTDALLTYVECSGLIGAQIIKFILNIAYLWMFAPLLAFTSLKIFIIAIALGLPVLYFYFEFFTKKLWTVSFGTTLLALGLFLSS